MIKIEGNISQTYVSIIIDLGSSLSYISLVIVEKCEILREKHNESWMVQLTKGTKKKVTKIVRGCTINMNGMVTKVELNILPLVSYGILMGMDWLESHKVVINCVDKSFTCVDDEGKDWMVKGIPKPISMRQISTTQLKKCARKGCEMFVIQIINVGLEDGNPSIESFELFREFQDVFPKEIMGLPPMQDIDFTIDPIPEVVPISKAPY